MPTSEWCVICKWLGMMQCRHFYICNAVAKLNELRKFDEFYLSYIKGGSHSLLDSICPKKG